MAPAASDVGVDQTIRPGTTAPSRRFESAGVGDREDRHPVRAVECSKDAQADSPCQKMANDGRLQDAYGGPERRVSSAHLERRYDPSRGIHPPDTAGEELGKVSMDEPPKGEVVP